MHHLRTFFRIDDDLQEFAQDWLNRESLLSSALSLTASDGVMVAVLYRDERFQVELCVVPGGLVIPPHTHPNADTIEVSVAGAIRLEVNGVEPFAALPDDVLARGNRWRGVRINATDVHGTVVPHPGAMFLSIQRWVCTPKSVLTDYRGAPLGQQHKEIISC